MAKEQLEESKVPLWLKVALSLIGFGFLVWSTAWAASKGKSAESNLVSSHEVRITKAESEIGSLDTRMDSNEKVNIAIQKDQQALLNGQNDIKLQQSDASKLMIEFIKENAETQAWIKSIEKVE